jgi:baculoviral IAP repeat-containing protein 6
VLLQVLVSLQSMVFVPDPYFNEPGYERSASTAAGEQASAAYNMGVRLGTASHALLPTLRVPDPVFKEALQVHYSHTGHRVRKLLQQWVHEARGQSQQQQQLKQVVAQVEEQLDRLPPPPAPPAEPPQQQRQQQQRHEAAPEVRRHHELQNAPASAVLDVLDLT